jgi:hypothetical protein
MKQLLTFFLLVVIVTSCSIERRHYLPGLHIEGRSTRGEGRWTKDGGRVAKCDEKSVSGREESQDLNVSADELELSYTAYDSLAASVAEEGRGILSPSPLAPRPSSFVPRPSPLEADTLKKPFKPQKQYREIDPVGKYAVITVLAAVALQKIAGMLTWFEVIVPLSFGPGVFIPALVVAFVGVCLSAYSAYRVRKYPEKYKKNEWGKAALAILGWQILMSVLFAWLLGGLPTG